MLNSFWGEAQGVKRMGVKTPNTLSYPNQRIKK